MQIRSLDHVNIRTANLTAMIDWYREVLGMQTGDRPAFRIDGAWLYAAGRPIVHLVEVPDQPKGAEPRLEHFALGATGMPEFVERLRTHGVEHTVDPVPGFPIVQVNLHDPDGNHIHVDFALEEAEAAGLV